MRLERSTKFDQSIKRLITANRGHWFLLIFSDGTAEVHSFRSDIYFKLSSRTSGHFVNAAFSSHGDMLVAADSG